MTLEPGARTGSLLGYGNRQVVSATVHEVFGQDANCFFSSDQGLWFAEGDLFYSRFYAQRLALQIKAREMGLLTPGGDGYVVPADVARTL